MWREDNTVQTESSPLVSENDSTALDRCFDVAVSDHVVRFVSRLKQCSNLPNLFLSGLRVKIVTGSIAGDSFSLPEPSVRRWRYWAICGRG
jgi:hypothetical protein